MLEDELVKLKTAAMEELQNVKTSEDLENFNIKYFGRREGELTKMLRGLKDLSLEEKREVGGIANDLRREIEEAMGARREALLEASAPKIDLTLSGKAPEVGHIHPISQFMRKVIDIFVSMGFEVIDGPEVETEKYNFDLLNIPADHPARDMWDTFYIKQPTANSQQPASWRPEVGSRKLGAVADCYCERILHPSNSGRWKRAGRQ